MEKIYCVVVTGFREEKMRRIDLCKTEKEMQEITVLRLKEKIVQQCPHLLKAVDFRLFHRGEELYSNSTPLSKYGIQHKSLIYIELIALKYGVLVNSYDGVKYMIGLCKTEEEMQKITVLQLKEKIAQQYPHKKETEGQRLLFKDRLLDEDSRLLSEYGIQNMSVIHMVIKVPGGGSNSNKEYLGKHDKGDKKHDKKHMSMECLADFKEEDGATPKEQKKVLSFKAREESLRLIFTDKMLDEDSKLLSEYGIQNLSHIHMVIKVPGGL